MGNWYGSITNRVDERVRGEEPKVGMGVTHYGWSDRYAYEVIEVKDARHIVVRRLDAIRTDHNGFSEIQEYEYKTNPNNPTERLYKNNKGRWVRRVGKNGVDNYGGWRIGNAEEYRDPCF